MEFYAAMKKNEMLSFAGKWMELENIILKEVNLAQKTKNHMFFPHMWTLNQGPSPLLQCTFSNSISLLCASFQFLVYYSVFGVCLGFFAWGGVSLSRGLCWFILGVAGGILHKAWHSPVGLPNVSPAGLEPASGDTAALLFSQCNVGWRSFLWARRFRVLKF
jgi:hypothetical protein